MATLTMRKGDTQVLRGAVTVKVAGVVTPVDITGWKIWFTAKRRRTDTDAQAVVAKAITMGAAANGRFSISFVSTDFGSIPNAERTVFLYDVQIKTDISGPVQTLGDGQLIILGDITNSVTF